MKPKQDGSDRLTGLGIPNARAWNIATRTAHIAVTSVLVGGHVFDVSKDDLAPWLYGAVVTGLVLTLIEAFPRLCWFYQGRGLFVIVKLMLLAAIPWVWDFRVPLLLAVIVLASVGSHMSARFRYYSVVHRRVLD